ncbi:MSMEG_0570 family nitrogen starvation response protein [Pseudomonas putida]|uniref:MSMEG_0570 family nitrogen starvation response protein n=1 Tax=Pseudomonas putida TaxID=303 RepID=UPI0018A9BE70|nr:MSMEG_0570 family nitrogen starvation response protein [Pseudomonas putida]MBF8668236.1 MSMEG_0570 family nitrogen starvation response protein [Pseudomonas putida]MBF8711736.1 MSMEG_0570 family nitrogen starvation response protein [Pseudomonas putida]
MPAVIIHLRWPDGRETTTYSPSTTIHQHLQAGIRYPLAEFLERAESGLTAASERVKEVKGFYCSSAMDSLGGLRLQARAYTGDDPQVEVLEVRQQDAAPSHHAAYGDL